MFWFWWIMISLSLWFSRSRLHVEMHTEAWLVGLAPSASEQLASRWSSSAAARRSWQRFDVGLSGRHGAGTVPARQPSGGAVWHSDIAYEKILRLAVLLQIFNDIYKFLQSMSQRTKRYKKPSAFLWHVYRTLKAFNRGDSKNIIQCTPRTLRASIPVVKSFVDICCMDLVSRINTGSSKEFLDGMPKTHLICLLARDSCGLVSRSELDNYCNWFKGFFGKW